MPRTRAILHSIVMIAAGTTTIAVLGGCDDLLKPQSSAENGAGGAADEPGLAKSGDSSAWPKEHTIEPDDTLFALAKKYYNDGSEWERIAHANPGVDATGLMVGHEITIPAPH